MLPGRLLQHHVLVVVSLHSSGSRPSHDSHEAQSFGQGIEPSIHLQRVSVHLVLFLGVVSIGAVLYSLQAEYMIPSVDQDGNFVFPKVPGFLGFLFAIQPYVQIAYVVYLVYCMTMTRGYIRTK
jgi:hypothetical protein